MSYYHVTTEASAERILEEGLKPRRITGQQTVYGTSLPSIDQYVYLACSYSAARGIVSSLIRERRLCILTVDSSMLDTCMLRPDEDFLTHIWFCLSHQNQFCYRGSTGERVLKALASHHIDFRFFALGGGFRGQLVFPGDRRWPTSPIYKAAVDNLGNDEMYRGVELLSFLWQLSVSENNTVAYKGIVPPEAIQIRRD